jgi:IS30 family transposase
LKKELLEHLRAKRTVRRSRHASLKRNGLGQVKDAVSISERPASVEDRAVPGHWEGDLIGGSKNNYIATLVERKSRYVMLVKVANKDCQLVRREIFLHAFGNGYLPSLVTGTACRCVSLLRNAGCGAWQICCA